MSRTVLVTGSAGFIGYFTSQALLAQGWNVIGLDAMTDYYDVELKKRRHEMLPESKNFTVVTERLETQSGSTRKKSLWTFNPATFPAPGPKRACSNP